MNLAELRKKAHQEKMLQETSGAATGEAFPDGKEMVLGAAAGEYPLPDLEIAVDPVFDEPVVPAAAAPDRPVPAVMPEPVTAAPALPEEVLPEPPVPVPPSAREEGHGGYDPVALIMAGRDAAGDDEETGADAVRDASRDVYEELLCFLVSTEVYAINILDIKEIIKPREITEVPRVPAFVSGVLSLRGIIIPVFNMRKRLGLPFVEGLAKERIIVIKKGEELCGLLVDEVIQVVRIAAARIEPPPAVLDAVDRDFVSGIGRHDDLMLILLNLGNILDVSLT